jgi:hypothetical protein
VPFRSLRIAANAMRLHQAPHDDVQSLMRAHGECNYHLLCLIKDKMAIFERMDANNVAHLRWATFTDARWYFNATHNVMGNPSASSFDWLIGAMESGTLAATLGAPLSPCLDGAVGPSKEVKQEATHRRKSRGIDEGPQPPAPNTNVHSRIEAATSASGRCNPAVDHQMVMAVAPLPKPRITTMQLKRAGCFEHLFFGKCATSGCSFKHDGEVEESKIDGAIAKMRPGLAKFVKLN